MSFLSPLFLIGLPLAAVPVVIHLLNRRQQRKISWGAMRFLLQAATRKRRLWRLTEILLLLLRTAVFLFFIFALARPLLPVTWLGGSVPREVILVLDQSMSMSRRVNGASLFELGLQKASAFLDQLKGADTVRVLLAGESPEWLEEEGRAATSGALRELRSRLSQLKPTTGAADLVACLREVADLEAAKDKAARVVIVITDGQRLGWRMDERPVWAAMRARLEQARIPTVVSVELLGEGASLENLAVDKVEAARSVGAVDQPLGFAASVRNHGPKSGASGLLTWRVNGETIGVSTVPELAPGASALLNMSHPFPAAGAYDLSCGIDVDDALSADNEAHFLVNIYDRLPVLVVEDPGPQEANSAPFILAALGARSPGGTQWRSVFEPTLIESARLASTDLSQYRCVLLADVRSLSKPVEDQLEDYVRNGGGVWLALGERTDVELFNQNIHRGGLGLAPLKLVAPLGDANDRERFVPMRSSSDAHPAMTLLADFQRLDLDRVRVYRRHRFDPFSGKDVSVLLQEPGGEPLVVERRLGQGRVLVQGTPLGVSWSTLPLCQVYVAMLHEWMWYLSEPNLPKRNVEVGEALVESAPDGKAEAQLQLPGARTVQLSGSLVGHARQFRFAGTRLPGLYALSVENGPPIQFNVQRHPRESTLDPLTQADQEQFAAMKQIKLNSGLDAARAAGKLEIPKHPLEGWLLTALAMVLLGELALAGWLTHQRTVRVKPVTM